VAPRDRLVHELVPDWERLPQGFSHPDVSDVAVDADDRVFVLTRGEIPVLVYDRDGTFLHAWGEGVFTAAHGITVGPDGLVYCVDNGDHTVRRFTTEGMLLLTVGTPGAAASTGYDGDPFSVSRAGPPFHRPTKACVLSSGAFFVSDGYGNARVHRFSSAGDLEVSWGEPGSGPGQFRLPHGIAATRDEQRLLVCDRENDRIQVFDLEGRYRAEWTGLARPTAAAVSSDGYVYVAELGRAGRVGSRCSILDPNGRIVARLGGNGPPDAPGSFFAAHGIALDSHDDLYVAEVTWAAGGKDGRVPETCHTLQKFTRRAQTPARSSHSSL
jgi:DNA-binding beta-propeller fold protein YncE